MRILFAISILSFLALIWAAVAITRRIRASHNLNSASMSAQQEFSQYLFAAAEDSHSSPPQRPINSYDQITSTERN